MNIFARILSHGFSLAVVSLLIVGFIYRGELFPDVALPGFPDREVTQVAKSEPSTGDGEVQQSDDDWMAGEAVSEGIKGTESAEITQEMGQPDLTAAEEGGALEMPADSAETNETNKTSEIAGIAETEGVPEATTTEVVSTDLPSIDNVDPIPENEGMSGSEKDVLSPAEAEFPEDSMGSSSIEAAQQADKESVSMPEPDVDQEANAVDEATTASAVEAAGTEVATEGETVVDNFPDAGSDSMSEKGITHTGDDSQSDAAEQPAPEITSVYKALARAREAYWLHDYPLAESSYRKMIELAPDSPDGYGELGNMYFAKGMWDKASSEYYEAGVRLVDTGHEQKARDLLSVIKGLNGQDAEKLEGYIASSAN